MRSKARIIVAMAAIFALFHIVIVAVPVLTSGGSGETQAFAAAIFDLPIFWLLGLFPAGRDVLYGSSRSLYILLFSVGGTHVRCRWCTGRLGNTQHHSSIPSRLTRRPIQTLNGGGFARPCGFG